LEVEEENKKGVSFYYKQGFSEVERKVDNIEGEQMTTIVMEKTLC
jgi:ribosomal protein S18 acetylase RimI-like enzyme